MKPPPNSTPFPALGEKLLIFLLPVEWQDEVIGDLHEVFVKEVLADGYRAAIRQFWFEFFRMLPFLLHQFVTKISKRRSEAMSPTTKDVPTLRRQRKIKRIILLTSMVLITIGFLRFALLISDYQADMRNRVPNFLSALMIEEYLTGSEISIIAPEVSGLLRDFVSDSAEYNNLKPKVPILPDPFSKIHHFVCGYRIHQKTMIQSQSIDATKIPVPLVTKILDQGPRHTATKEKVTINEFLYSKSKGKSERDSLLSMERLERGAHEFMLQQRTVTRGDAAWEIRLSMLSRGDTLFFRGAATDKIALDSLRPQLYEATIENCSAIKLHLRENIFPPHGEYADGLAIVKSKNGKIIYKRGDTTGCIRIFPEKNRIAHRNEIFSEYYLDKRLMYEGFYTTFKRILLYTAIFLVCIAITAYGMGKTQGESWWKKTRVREQEWEREQSVKE